MEQSLLQQKVDKEIEAYAEILIGRSPTYEMMTRLIETNKKFVAAMLAAVRGGDQASLETFYQELSVSGAFTNLFLINLYRRHRDLPSSVMESVLQSTLKEFREIANDI